MEELKLRCNNNGLFLGMVVFFSASGIDGVERENLGSTEKSWIT